MPEGHQSPPPERQSGAQLQDPPASGKGVNKTGNENPKDQLQASSDVSFSPRAELICQKNLESNPTDIMEDVLKDKFAKNTKKE